jgi:hypothetical protein
VSNLLGVCPLLSFTVDGRTVTTLPTTLFLGDGCSRIKNRTNVSAQGTLQVGGLVLATQIEVGKDE